MHHHAGLGGGDLGPAHITIGPDGSVDSVRPWAPPVPAEAGGPELTAIPLLADSHLHLGISDGVHDDPDFHTIDHIDGQLEQLARFGIGLAHSLGTDQPWLTETLVERRAADPLGRAVGHSAGVGFGAVDGWPPELTRPRLRYRPTEPEQARGYVRDLAAQGCTTVKIWTDSFGGTVPKTLTAIARAIIAEAHDHGITTFAHVKDHADAESLVELEVDVLAHSIRDRPISDRLLDSMAVHGTTLVPTLSREEAEFAFSTLHNPYLEDDSFRRAAGPRGVERLRHERLSVDPAHPARSLEIALENVRRTHTHGIDVGLGTDSGFRFKLLGFAQHRELELLTRAGLSTSAALGAGLAVNRRLLGAEQTGIDSTGPASFFIVEGDPWKDIRATQSIEEVWISGRRIVAHSPESSHR
ncbi:amidohydrolase family protein [Frondihabitans cladoniiphilus]|uniref:Amidohydrolase family protein n=1 Tax=Frondihabitans cladoniiphilus TaxID=715785 RepID=A0ABP8WE85_9MICO